MTDAVRLSTRRWKPCAPTVGRDEHKPLLKRLMEGQIGQSGGV